MIRQCFLEREKLSIISGTERLCTGGKDAGTRNLGNTAQSRWNDTLRSFHFILTILGLDAKE